MTPALAPSNQQAQTAPVQILLDLGGNPLDLRVGAVHVRYGRSPWQRGGVDCLVGAHVDSYFCRVFCGDDCLGVLESHSDYFLEQPRLELLDIGTYGPSQWFVRNKGAEALALTWPDGRAADVPADGQVYRLEALAIYTGTMNPRQAGNLSPDANSKNAYVYFWENSQALELDTMFRHDKARLDILDVQTGEEEYTFLRDKPSGYIRQLTGPAKPIIVANLGAIPLRVDTLLGRFTVHAGTMLRLDGSTPQREKKKVRLTVTSRYEQPLESAELWDGTAWQRLNICEEKSPLFYERLSLTVRDGSAIV